ncbi:tyrosine-protein kinase Mer-like [Mizuhopecten yessoensis]|uniref:tyrosine-protein kinase Mer-like n=1 Tax=Mizuhopecten yessoensis TaxID=6573 RepID=UPI000B458889|nr:tyrosine-protein kinase Mer-like [Mizuhopecten yessoensis]
MYGTTLVRTLTGDVTTHGRTLTLTSVSYQDSGTYTCHVHNSIRGRDGQLIQTGSAVSDFRGSPKLLEKKSLYVTEKENHLNITMTFISHPSPTDMFISKTGRLSSTSVLNITFIKGTVKDNIYGKDISRGGYRVHLDFPSFQINQEGDYSLTVTNNVSPNLIHSFEIGIVDVPDTPTNISADKITTESAVISWTPGLNRGKDNQSFHLWIKESTADVWIKYYTPQDVSRIVISDLRTASTFEVVLFAANEKGTSNNMTLQFTTLSAVKDPSVAPLIGGISGGVIGLLLIIIGIVFYRRMSNGTNKPSGNRSDATPFNNDRDDDDGIKMNILYESAGPYRQEDPNESGQPENAYAIVNKKTPAGAVNAEVVPKKDRTAAKGKAEGSGDVYAEVQKAEKKKKKQKKPSKDKQGGNVYENASAVGGKPEEVYANTDDTASKLEEVKKNGSKDTRRKNKDGLVYLDLEFQQQPDGTRQAVIRGIENRNDYSEVDFAKCADPMSAEDDDVNVDEKKEDSKN